MKIAALLLTVTCSQFLTTAQTLEAIMKFTGTDSPEELNPYEVERLEDLLEHPLRINYASASKMTDTGLFSIYQIASLTDYIRRHGDVMSFMELAAVDGFGEDFTQRIAPFISLESSGLPTGTTGIRNEASLRTSLKSNKAATYGLKYKLTAGERISAGLSVSRTSDSKTSAPDAFSGHLAYYMKRWQGKIILGDFNARFGQGLSLWNGLDFNTLASPSTFMKRPSGISVSSSFTGNYSRRGVAADIQAGRFRVSAFMAVKGLEQFAGGKLDLIPAANLAMLFRNGQISLTHYMDFSIAHPPVAPAGLSGNATDLTGSSASDPALPETTIPEMKTSADFAFCFKGTDIYGEFAYDWVAASISSLLGVSSRIAGKVPVSAMLRYLPSKEYAVSTAAALSSGKTMTINGAEGFGATIKRHKLEISADAAYYPISKSDDGRKSLQLKSQIKWDVMISNSVRAEVRLSERIRTWGQPFRTDLRADFKYLSEYIYTTIRLNALHSKSLGLLAYAEGGYRTERLSLYLRQGFFRADNWDDRIYAYERDAPGSFNVPAYYGRGLWTAATFSWKFTRWGRLYFRAAYTAYPFPAAKKPGRAELKLQFVISI